MLAWMLPIGLSLGAPAKAPLTDAQLLTVLEEQARLAHAPLPVPGPKQRARLREGKLVKMRLPSTEGGPVGAMALVVADLPLEEVWVGTADADMDDGDNELLSLDLPTRGDEVFRWYGYLDLPAPIADRHFLIRTSVDEALHAQTAGRIWARHWTIEADGLEVVRPLVAQGRIEGLSPEAFAEAIWVPHNTGTWLFARLPEGRTLLGYQATASLGGSFPDGLVNRTIYWGLDRLMEEILGQARRARGHYRAGHDPLPGGDGGPLAPFE